jgi:dTDP-4-amino-4,6-dideoxygalactose transaminase
MILLNDFKRQWADTSADVMRTVEAVGLSGWYILGENVRKFEHDLAAYWGIAHAIGVASGLDAIELSLRALGCGAGDLVLTSPISAFATPLAIMKLGAVPIFADCDEHGLIDLDECRAILSARPEIRYFVPVHLYGYSLNLAKLRALRDDFNLRIVEDCAQSIGATYCGETCGAIGQFTATSFYPTKNLGALGDGGAVLTASAEGAGTIRTLRDYGQSAKYRHDVQGYNSRLDELQAAILREAFLPRLANWTEARRRIAHTYLAGIRTFRILPIGEPEGSKSSWHLFPTLVNQADKASIMAHFKSKGVLVAEHYPLALNEQPAMDAVRSRTGSTCDRARDFCHRELSLPIHPYLTNEEIAHVIATCNEVS